MKGVYDRCSSGNFVSYFLQSISETRAQEGIEMGPTDNRQNGKFIRITKHAQARSQQRGISEDIMEIIWKYGRTFSGRNGAEKVFFGSKEYEQVMGELKTMMKNLERARNCVLVENTGNIITVYKTN